jgi:hypothetical protein
MRRHGRLKVVTIRESKPAVFFQHRKLRHDKTIPSWQYPTGTVAPSMASLSHQSSVEGDLGRREKFADGACPLRLLRHRTKLGLVAACDARLGR